jgi:cell division ATPase FtsA
VDVGGLSDHVNSPAFATAVGLVLYAQRNHMSEAGRLAGAGVLGRVAGRLRGLFKEFF